MITALPPTSTVFASTLAMSAKIDLSNCSASVLTSKSVIVFESEEAAKAAAERIQANVPQGVTFESAEVREVVASA